MVTKRQIFRGSALADRLGTLNNFICNDADNLKWAPQFDVTELGGSIEGVAENRFRVAEYISPLWSKISVDYEKEALYDEHDAQIDVYGMDNLGLETLIYQNKLIDTEFGVPGNVQIDMLRSACTGAVSRLDSQETLDGYMKIKMPKLAESYDAVKVRSPWYDSAWSKRKGIPINGSPKRLHGELQYTDDQTGDAQFMVPEAMTHDYWTFVIDVAYEAEMQADFGDLRFCGYDAVSPLEHWIISKTDSSTAKVMVRVPWYYGYKDIHPMSYGTVYGQDLSQAETGTKVPEWASEPDFIWMYYGNASATDGSTTPVAGEKGVLYFNDFDGTITDMETHGTDANSTITQTGTVLRLKINANNTNTGIWWTKVIPEMEGKAVEVIWKLTDKPATAGNYDSTLTIGQRDSLAVALDDYFGAWIDAAHVYTADVINSATASSWTTGGLSFDHDDVEPYYVKFRTHPTHESEKYMGVSVWLSRDCVEWTQYAHLIENDDLTWNAQTQLKAIGMRLSAWAAAPAFDMILDVDWVIVQEYHETPHRGDQFRDSFIGSQYQYNWVGSGSAAGTKIFALDTVNQQVDFTISGVSARYDSGLNTAPIITAGVLGKHTSFLIETKVSAHARTTAGATRATLSLGSDANKHFDVQHQLYDSAAYNEEIRCVSTYGGVDYIKNETQYETVKIADGPIWLRIAGDQSTGQLWGMYSRDGYNWKTCGHDSLKSSYSDATNIRLLLANNGGGNATCSFDYIKVQTGPEVADNGRAITAAQSYGDWDEIDPLATQYINYVDGFEDELITGRTWPYLDWVDISGKSTAIPYLWGTAAGAEMLAENQSTFETGVSLTALNATITQSSTVAHSGTYSAKIVGTADDSAGAPGGDHAAGTFRLGMAPGKFYELTGWHYTPNTECLEDEATGTQDARKGRPVLFYQDSGGTVREIHGEGIKATNTWEFFRFRFYLVSSALSAAIRLYCGENGSTVYYDDLSLKEVQTPITGNKSIRIGGGASADYSGVHLPMPYKTYSINFDWCPLYDNYRDGGPFFPLLRFKDAADGQNYSEIGLYKDGTTVELKVYAVSDRTTSTENYGVVFRAFDHVPQKVYNVHIAVDEGRIRCWIDGVSKISGGYAYGTATNQARVFPSHYISIGSEIYHQAIWDNFQIRPGLWRIEPDLTTWTQYAYQATPGPTLPSVSQPSFSSKWSDVYDQQDTYQFKFPTGYVRGQPMQVMWKDLGADEWQYSKPFRPGVKGVFEVGPNGLDKYIGMKTVIKFVGDEDHRFEVKNITYEYEV